MAGETGGGIGGMFVRIIGDNGEFDDGIDKSEKRLTKFGNTCSNMGKKLSLFVTAPIVAAGVAALKSAGQMQMYQASFETMLGSADKANKIMKEMQEFAAVTPFEFTDLAEVGKTLLQFNVPAKDLMTTIKALGDVAQGNGERFRSLSLAFGQMTAAGRLMGQDLLQMINAGFNPLQEIAKKTGLTMGELKKKMEQGAISAEMVAAAFKSATQEGGTFFNGMEKASKTLPGLLSTLKDDTMTTARSFAQFLLPTVIDVVKGLSSFAKWLNDLSSGWKKAILIGGAFAASIGPVLIGVGQLTTAIVALNTAGLLGPTGIVIALGAAAAALAVFVSEARKRKKELDDIAAGKSALSNTEQLAALDKELGRLGYVYGTVNDSIIILNKSDKERLKLLAEQRAAVYEKVRWDTFAAQAVQVLGDENATAAEKVNALTDYLKNNVEVTKEFYQTEQMEEAKSRSKENLAAAQAHVNAVQNARSAALEKWVTDTNAANAKVDAAREADKNAEKAALAEKQAAQQAYWSGVAANLIQLVGLINQIQAERTQTEIEYLEQQKEAELYAAEQSGLTAEALAAKKSEIEKKYQKQIAELKYKSDMATWETNKFMTIASGIRAGIESYVSAGGWPLGAIAAAIMAGITAAQVAALEEAKPVKPKFARGAIVPARPGGLEATIAEGGQTEAVIPLDRLDEMLARMGGRGSSMGGGMVHLQVMLDKKPFLDTIFPATRDGTVLIHERAVVS